jgi:hypothetical protein
MPTRNLMTHAQHRDRHRMLHEHLDELLADYLQQHLGKLPSTTSVMELLVWAHEQTIEPTGGDAG